MTISSQSLDGLDKARLKNMLDDAKKKDREALNKKFARIIKEAIEESGDPQIRSTIANKIKARILK
jgi:hypothetical protein